MPLRDHFQQPLEDDLPWPSLFAGWNCALVKRLNLECLPDRFVAHNHFKIRNDDEMPLRSHDPVSSSRPGWEVPPPMWTVPRLRYDHLEIHVKERGQVWASLPAAVEFVIPPHKESVRHRRAFLSRCAALLSQGTALAIIDIVTHRPGCLFNDLLTFLGIEDIPRLPAETGLFAAAFRPVSRGDWKQIWDTKERREMEVWASPLAIGEPLPTMPLRLIYDQFTPVEFEPTYTQSCHDHKVY